MTYDSGTELEQRNAVIPWARLLALIEPHYPTDRLGPARKDLDLMLRVWGITKVRYRGVAKTLAKAYSMFALASLYLIRRRLMPPGATCAL